MYSEPAEWCQDGEVTQCDVAPRRWPSGLRAALPNSSRLFAPRAAPHGLHGQQAESLRGWVLSGLPVWMRSLPMSKRRLTHRCGACGCETVQDYEEWSPPHVAFVDDEDVEGMLAHIYEARSALRTAAGRKGGGRGRRRGNALRYEDQTRSQDILRW